MYVVIADITKRLNRTLTADETTLMSSFIMPAIQQFIDNFTGRIWESPAKSSDYWYYGRSGNRDQLELNNDFIDVDSIEAFDSDGNSLGVVDDETYELHPLNSDHSTMVMGKTTTFSYYKYKVTGKIATTATPPADIKQVMIDLCANLLTNPGGVKSESIEGYSYTLANIVEETPLIKNTLEYRKRLQI